MLKKLLKHDILAVGHAILPFYLFLAASTLLARFLVRPEKYMNEALPGYVSQLQVTLSMIFGSAYGLALLIVMGALTVILVLHFYRTTLTDEAYLTFTLPVSRTQYLVSKLLSGALWTVITALMALGSALLQLLGRVSMYEVVEFIREFLSQLTQNVVTTPKLVFYVLAWFILFLFETQVTFYFCISVGTMFPKNRVLAAVIAWILLHLVSQIFSFGNSMSGFFSFGGGGFLELLLQQADRRFLFSYLRMILLFAGADWILTKKLNLL